ncbi:B-4DMT family transporter [Mycolicibacillus parakoreensis]|uniref:B-4DMT family transporter n=1 Tax=Mycolicibacillus parakoreensis TaxID=1069221 RepID=A0ABY3TY67_9MYCO|nr:B-4DMT family transporter [Mycolicibacillus parakoreensis]MCV7316892.1 B-4DMT family transporter [Mycolicibacillus parakoreensis]ULN51246.1 B-4DMT family transporter [Mycolicibacillus parakoreensis]HLR98432.1 B-4DMT family transporter [Mycolicibacillus parakoreensis]
MTNNWVLRGLVLAAGMLVLRLIQGVLINTFEMYATLISVSLLVIFIVGAATWAYFDGRENAKSDPDPERRADLAMTWLLAGITAGVLSGVAAWLIALFDPAIYTGGLLNELTGIAAFTALVAWVPAMAAVALGRWQIDKNYDWPSEHGEAGAEGDRADTDVFAAVDPDAQAAGEAVSEAASEEPTTALATLPDFAPAPPKKRWWQRRKPAASETSSSAEATAPTAYTMDQTEPVSYDPADTEATTEFTTPAPSADESTTEFPPLQTPEQDDPEQT